MTDTSKMRSEFESFCREAQGWGDDDFSLASDGVNYYWSTTGDAWMFWQASRQALIVELPSKGEPFYVADIKSFSLHNEGRNKALDECCAAIEAVGLRCEVRS